MVEMINGDVYLKSLREEKRKKLEKKYVDNPYDRQERDPNAGEAALSRDEFTQHRRDHTVKSTLTPKAKKKIATKIEDMECPYCHLKMMHIVDNNNYTGEITVTCGNYWCTNNAFGPFKFNAMQYAFDNRLMKEHTGTPMRMW